MGTARSGSGDGRKRKRQIEAPIPLSAVDLLAGLAPGVELAADDLPAGIGGDDAVCEPSPTTMTVAEAGRQVRAGEGTIRRLIRTPVLRPETRAGAVEPDRAGVLPRSPEKPGE
jgi:hypothetical protein